MQSLSKSIDQAVSTKIAALAPIAGVWRYYLNPAHGAHLPSFQDLPWTPVSLPYTWSSQEGEAWFHTTLSFPDHVHGIPLAGSSLDLDIWLTIGATVYVDGEPRFTEESWTDSRATPLTISTNLIPGRTLELAVRCNAGDGFGVFIQATPRVSALEASTFALDTVRAQVVFTEFLLEQMQVDNRTELVAVWESACAALDLDALATDRWDAWHASTIRMCTQLAPFATLSKEYTAYLVGHSHIDMNWLWPTTETLEVCRRDFTAADKLMDRFSNFVFSQSQAAAYRLVEEADPDLFARMRARIAEGRWEVTASTWVEGDLNQACGEALIRQIMLARQYLSDRFAVTPVLCWEPDTFGHAATLPQILAQCGIKYYYFCRAGRRLPIFWWEGLDGSRVLAVQDLRWYMGEVKPTDAAGSVVDFVRAGSTRTGLFVYGVGDHGGGATVRDLQAAQAMHATPYLPAVEPAPATTFFQTIEDNAATLPVVRGELNTVFEGCYTTHADIKRLNRDLENALLTAETATALAAMRTGLAASATELAEHWRTLCFHQFHDILGGCAIGVTYREAQTRMNAAITSVQTATQRAVTHIAAATDTHILDTHGPAPINEVRIVVFNPLDHERTDIVRIPLAPFSGLPPASLVDDAGLITATQICGSELLFLATGIPALGTRVYAPTAAMASDSNMHFDVRALTMDNGISHIRVHPDSGAIDQWILGASGRDLAARQMTAGVEARAVSGGINRLQVLWEQPHPMSAWHLGDIAHVDNLITGADVKLVEAGPVRGVIEVRRDILHSHLVQRIVLYRGVPRVEFQTMIDWHERGSANGDAPMLRATFAPVLGETQAAFEIPFAGLTRAASGDEVPALRWADISERNDAAGGAPGHGLALLNDGKYGHQAQGNTLGLTLVRSAYEPDNNPDEGVHQFCYALFPHEGDWRAARVSHQASALNQPLVPVLTDAHVGTLKPGEAGWRCSDSGISLSAVKLAENQPDQGRTFALRIYEAHGKSANATIALPVPIGIAELANPIEEVSGVAPLEDGIVSVALRPHEIRTFLLHLTPQKVV